MFVSLSQSVEVVKRKKIKNKRLVPTRKGESVSSQSFDPNRNIKLLKVANAGLASPHNHVSQLF